MRPLSPSEEYETPWRNTSWGFDSLIQTIKAIEPCKNDLKYLRVLVVGPNGSGKSSFINSINNAFKGRITSEALSDTISSKSFTYTPYEIETGNSSLTVVINDVMGLEEGFKQGCPLEDIIKAINGHVKQGHEFKPEKPLSSDDPDYIEKPAPSDQAFCLVNVLAADRIQLTDGSVMEKLRNIRLNYVIQIIIQKCQFDLLINYHEEIDTNDDMDVLILQALTQIIQLANDNVKICLAK
uniref:Si:ch211-208g24.8 n=1 Tax=Cyprinus carpio TaxID=7962 RepID=A0A8C2CIG2_CYPCA